MIRENTGILGGNTENVGNQGGDTGSQGWNVGITAQITENSSGNDKFKECREVKIIEKEHICKELISNIWFGALTCDIFCAMSFCFYYWFWAGK